MLGVSEHVATAARIVEKDKEAEQCYACVRSRPRRKRKHEWRGRMLTRPTGRTSRRELSSECHPRPFAFDCHRDLVDP